MLIVVYCSLFVLFFFFFFFSSRRRHTRCLSDWSSDVCSSDLARSWAARRSGQCNRNSFAHHEGSRTLAYHTDVRSSTARSEERRVGKGVDLGGRGINKKKK